MQDRAQLAGYMNKVAPLIFVNASVAVIFTVTSHSVIKEDPVYD